MTIEERKLGVKLLVAFAQAIHDAGEIPSGHLYAMAMNNVTLPAYESLIGQLCGTGLVEKRGDLLRWAGPKN